VHGAIGQHRLERRVNLHALVLEHAERRHELSRSLLVATHDVEQAHVRASEQIARVDRAHAAVAHERHAEHLVVLARGRELRTLGAAVQRRIIGLAFLEAIHEGEGAGARAGRGVREVRAVQRQQRKRTSARSKYREISRDRSSSSFNCSRYPCFSSTATPPPRTASPPCTWRIPLCISS